MTTRILITGGSGLLALNWAVATRDRYSVTLGTHSRDVFLDGVQSVRIDVDSAAGATAACETIRPELVIHTVALTNVDECEGNPELARHTNVEIAANVSRACATLGVPLVHVSTDQLFAGDRAFVDETEPPAPRNVYGRTKAEAEARVLDAHPGALVIRTNFYGWGPSFRRSFSDWIIETLRSGTEITLFLDVCYTPILIASAVQAAHDLVEADAAGIFHVTADERISKYDFGLRLAEEFELNPGLIKPGRLAHRVTTADRPREMSLSNRKTRDLLGRSLGRVAEQVAALHAQEQRGLVRELRAL